MSNKKNELRVILDTSTYITHDHKIPKLIWAYEGIWVMHATMVHGVWQTIFHHFVKKKKKKAAIDTEIIITRRKKKRKEKNGCILRIVFRVARFVMKLKYIGSHERQKGDMCTMYFV
ncbi:hypothetical protein S83_061869 [Arachis hypogaea]